MSRHYYYHHIPKSNPHKHPDILDVILVVSNTARYESRYRLFKKVQEELTSQENVRVSIVELAFGERPFIIGEMGMENLLLRTPDELWHKENMINLAIQRLPPDWKYVAWVDADVTFIDKHWAREAIEALQHYKIIQPWSSSHDLGPYGETVGSNKSFCSLYLDNKNIIPNRDPYYGGFPHSGYAWCARRSAINDVGGLIDTAILGAADHHMASALIGMAQKTIHGGVHPCYRDMVMNWQERALKYIKKNIGATKGTIVHSWHGKKRDRKYRSRWQILVENQFNPNSDLTKDWQGLWQLRVDDERQIRLRDQVREYMSSRNEDSVDIL